MTEDKNYQEVEEIASKHLGQKGGEGYSTTYDPDLLVRIPRRLNRDSHNIYEHQLPFVGYDVWNAYEVSTLTNKGFPVTGVMKIVYPSNSKYHVESKSIKLYLNSFNMTKMGNSIGDTVILLETKIASDLSKLLETDVKVNLFRNRTAESMSPYNLVREMGAANLEALVDVNNLSINTYKAKDFQLERRTDGVGKINVFADFLRSNCRVTNQPDWGTLLISMQGSDLPTFKSLAEYIVSHRQVNHFHEEVVEMVFKNLKDQFDPDVLTVSALYTRRGGIDINPIRSTHFKYIPTPFVEVSVLNGKTLAQ